MFNYYIDSWLSRFSTARESDSGLSLGHPTKVKAHKCYLFTEVSLKVEIKNYIPLKTPSNTLFIAKWLNRIVDIAISNAKVAIFVV